MRRPKLENPGLESLRGKKKKKERKVKRKKISQGNDQGAWKKEASELKKIATTSHIYR